MTAVQATAGASRQGRIGSRGRELQRHIGNVLAIQHKMVGRVETGEKPELLWEYLGLERLYVRLAVEYELRDRDRALDRKLDVISRTVETLLELLPNPKQPTCRVVHRAVDRGRADIGWLHVAVPPVGSRTRPSRMGVHR
jgi:required for meiotic nuclear division protein 1